MMQRQLDVKTPRLLPFALGVFALLALLAAACGQPAATGGPAATASRTVPAIATAVVATPAATSAGPGTGGVCHALGNSGTATEAAIEVQHGLITGCISTAPPMLVVRGAPAGDPRPGILICAGTPAVARPDCGAGLRVPVSQSRNQSHAQEWRFYPFPAPGATLVGSTVFPQQYQCVGTDTQLWTFHLDTFAYTPGCLVPPGGPSGFLTAPCDFFMYESTESTAPIYNSHGKAVGCGLLGGAVVGVVDGKPGPGIALCSGAAAPSVSVVDAYCGFIPLNNEASHWQFIPLPVASGPVTGATFDTAAGTACISAAGQSFTFTVATRAVTPGCAGAPAATATP